MAARPRLRTSSVSFWRSDCLGGAVWGVGVGVGSVGEF